MSLSAIEVKMAPSMQVVSYKMTIPTNDVVPAHFDTAHRALRDFLTTKEIKAIGPFISFWHQPPSVIKNEVVEGIFEIEKSVEGEGSVQVDVMPEVLVAAITHEGEFEEMIQAHKALQEWIIGSGYKFMDKYREIYHKNEPADMSHSITEIQYLIQEKSV